MESTQAKATLFGLDAAELTLLAKIEALFTDLAHSEDATPDPGAESERLVDEHLAALTDVQDQIGAKLAGYVKAIKAKQARASMLAAEAELYQIEANRLTARARSEADTAEFLSFRLKAFMERRGLTELEAGNRTIKIVKVGGELPIIFAPGVEPTQAPAEFRKEIPARWEWKKDAIKAALKSGQKLELAPADHLISDGEERRIEWARFGDRQTKLKIS